MDWKAALRDVRAHLPPSGQGGLQRGSLRWLEQEMQRRGGNPAALRNIIYRDTGTPGDKAIVRTILTELSREAGLSLDLPDRPGPVALPDELELLGRSKKRIYKQFLAGVTAGRAPRLVIAGKRGSGKTVLLGHVAQAVEAHGLNVTRLNLSGNVYQESGAVLRAAGRSYAALAEQQRLWVKEQLPAAGVLLVRVTGDLNFDGSPPRAPDGQAVTSAAWAALLLQLVPEQVAALVALEDPAGWPGSDQAITEMQPPTPSEARTYLIQKLGVTRQAAQELLKETGRNLDRLTLLAGAGGSVTQLLSDPDMRRLASSIQALLTLDVPAPFPDQAVQQALGQDVAALPVHARAQLHGNAADGWTPNQTLHRTMSALPETEVQEGIQRLAELPDGPEFTLYRLTALAHLREWPKLVRAIAARPDDARFLPALWPRIRRDARPAEREALAREVVNHHAGRGEYDSPRARDALFSLLESEADPVRAWARVKLAESSLDAGNFSASEQQLAHPDVQAILRLEHGADRWSLAAQADALLLQAALARWKGDMEAATQAVQDSRTAQSGPRVQLWRGLIAKDAGRWPEAIQNLQAVPATSPLLSARARYQEGDLRLRLGQPQSALVALQDAAARLEEAGGTREELARILARAATAQRRLGRPEQALELAGKVMQLVPPADRRQDRVLRARLLSEQIPILLALHRTDAALEVAARALALLEHPDAREAEAQYRQRRTHYRVALTYLTRGVGVPYLQPLSGPERDSPDLEQARDLLDHLLTRTPDPSDREQVLTFDMRLSRALAEPAPEVALEHVARALDMTDHPYAETQARAIRADALLRAGQTDAAMTEVNRAYALLRRVQVGLPGTHEADPALQAQLLALEARATIAEGQRTVEWLRGALRESVLHPFQYGVWREVGRALERQGEQGRRLMQTLHPAVTRLPLRLRDALPLLEGSSE